ncbi:hypothetical protein T492DRAFT_390930 [Pavlovales sp. CCMP2436]|nr:hypothetical protein T492DRAFT_390930 [Pavlovales sp. CCMP2436]
MHRATSTRMLVSSLLALVASARPDVADVPPPSYYLYAPPSAPAAVWGDTTPSAYAFGSILRANISLNEMQYFTTSIPKDAPAVKVSVVPLFGDADAYLSFEPFVAIHDAMWHMDNPGMNELLLRRSASDWTCRAEEACPVHFALFGYSTSEYLFAITSLDDPTVTRFPPFALDPLALPLLASEPAMRVSCASHPTLNPPCASPARRSWSVRQAARTSSCPMSSATCPATRLRACTMAATVCRLRHTAPQAAPTRGWAMSCATTLASCPSATGMGAPASTTMSRWRAARPSAAPSGSTTASAMRSATTRAAATTARIASMDTANATTNRRGQITAALSM